LLPLLFATIPIVIGPGLAKARVVPLVLVRHPVLVRSSDSRLRDLFARADVMTEGSARDEPGGRFWYGSTSVILPADDRDSAWLAAVAGRDMHVRLRAVRTAHREACLRAPGRLGRFACEIRIVPDARGVRVDVDVQAPLIERRATSRARP
jgi:hypothetical protein